MGGVYYGFERPESKWTKSAMMDEIRAYVEDEGLDLDTSRLGDLRKDDLFRTCFKFVRVERTGACGNETFVYALDEGLIDLFAEDEGELAEAMEKADLANECAADAAALVEKGCDGYSAARRAVWRRLSGVSAFSDLSIPWGEIDRMMIEAREKCEDLRGARCKELVDVVFDKVSQQAKRGRQC